MQNKYDCHFCQGKLNGELHCSALKVADCDWKGVGKCPFRKSEEQHDEDLRKYGDGSNYIKEHGGGH